MSKNNYLSNELSNWEAHPPETNYLGSSPPQELIKLNYAIYLDFDNIYGGLLDFLNIKAQAKTKDEKPTKLQFLVFKEALKCLINSLSIVFPERTKYIKAFAEYENLPHKDKFKPNIQAFLYNLGVKPVNPFVAYSTGSGKGKNASDIALSLEVVSDVLVKKNPIDLIIIASGDIDLYPLVSWIREYTDKEIFMASFEDRLNNIYKQVIDFKAIEPKTLNLAGVEKNIQEKKYLIFLDRTILECFKDISLSIIKNINSIRIEEKSISWLKSNIEKLLLSEEVLNEEERKFILEFLKQDFKEIIKEQSVKEEKDEPCEKFKKNLIKGLKNWLKSHDKASTGLIIKSWFPNWNIDMSENEANQCLKNILEDIEKFGFKFYGNIQDNLIIGEFRNG